MARRDRVGTGVAATCLVVAIFVGGTIAAIVAVDRGDEPATAPEPTPAGPVTVPVEVARESAVLVDAFGCSLDNQGSGVVIAEGVVTNAHVVAGATDITVTTDAGDRLRALVRAFDPVRDLALLEVDGLDVAPLGTDAPVGGTDAIALVRSDEDVEVAEVRIERTINIISTDIFGLGEHRRRGLELVADIDAGDSGGAILGPDGSIVGIVFSASRTQADVAYAVSALEIPALVAGAGDLPAEAGRCLRP
ncbi:MAG: trypsin-like peptidase domain-containing protein [Actinomycetota bacterium]